MPSIENKMIKKLLHNIDRNISILEIRSGYCQKTEFLQNNLMNFFPQTDYVSIESAHPAGFAAVLLPLTE